MAGGRGLSAHFFPDRAGRVTEGSYHLIPHLLKQYPYITSLSSLRHKTTNRFYSRHTSVLYYSLLVLEYSSEPRPKWQVHNGEEVQHHHRPIFENAYIETMREPIVLDRKGV
jgi:hypothetical protein